MSKHFLLLLLATTFARVAASEQPTPLILEGVVLRENGAPVANVPITAVQRAPWSLVGPIADKEVGRTVSDHKGHFTLQVPQGTSIRGLILVACAEWTRMKSKEGDIGLLGTSVPLRRVNEKGTNRIIVPNNFRPTALRSARNDGFYEGRRGPAPAA